MPPPTGMMPPPNKGDAAPHKGDAAAQQGRCFQAPKKLSGGTGNLLTSPFLVTSRQFFFFANLPHHLGTLLSYNANGLARAALPPRTFCILILYKPNGV